MKVNINPSFAQISRSVTSLFKPIIVLSKISFDPSINNQPGDIPWSAIKITKQRIKNQYYFSSMCKFLDCLAIYYGGTSPPPTIFFPSDTESNNSTMKFEPPLGVQDWFPTKRSLNEKLKGLASRLVKPYYNLTSNGKLASETISTNGYKMRNSKL